MRIMHVLNHTRRLNGHVHAAVDLACAQEKLGHKVCIVSGGGDFDPLLEQNGVNTRHLSHDRKVGTLLRSFVQLRRHLQEWRPDVVHAHMMTSAVLAYPGCRMARTPLVTTVHNEFEKSAILMGLGARVIAVSDAVAASMRRRGVSDKKLGIVLNGTIGSARFRERDRNPADIESPAIVFVGGLHPRKGLPDLLEAFRSVHGSHPEARLYVVGEGPMEAEYRQQAIDLGCADAIIFVGAMEDPYPYMLAADIFVLPSHADPAPLVISEAREAGCAVVGTNVDGIPQLLEYGEAGILVPPRQPDALAKVLKELLDDPATLAEWKARSQINVANLKIDRVASQTLGIYNSTVPFNTQILRFQV